MPNFNIQPMPPIDISTGLRFLQQQQQQTMQQAQMVMQAKAFQTNQETSALEQDLKKEQIKAAELANSEEARFFAAQMRRIEYGKSVAELDKLKSDSGMQDIKDYNTAFSNLSKLWIPSRGVGGEIGRVIGDLLVSAQSSGEPAPGAPGDSQLLIDKLDSVIAGIIDQNNPTERELMAKEHREVIRALMPKYSAAIRRHFSLAEPAPAPVGEAPATDGPPPPPAGVPGPKPNYFTQGYGSVDPAGLVQHVNTTRSEGISSGQQASSAFSTQPPAGVPGPSTELRRFFEEDTQSHGVDEEEKQRLANSISRITGWSLYPEPPRPTTSVKSRSELGQGNVIHLPPAEIREILRMAESEEDRQRLLAILEKLGLTGFGDEE